MGVSSTTMATDSSSPPSVPAVSQQKSPHPQHGTNPAQPLRSNTLYPSHPSNVSKPTISPHNAPYHTDPTRRKPDKVFINFEGAHRYTFPTRTRLSVEQSYPCINGGEFPDSPVLMRKDVKTMQQLQQDWFPVQYDQGYYEDCQCGRVFVLTAREAAKGNSSKESSKQSSQNNVSESTSGGESSPNSNGTIVGLLSLRYDLSARSDVPSELLPRMERHVADEMFYYIATVGVIHSLRGCGIAQALIEEVLRVFGNEQVEMAAKSKENSISSVSPASNIVSIEKTIETDSLKQLRRSGRVGVYLHVIDFNTAAQRLYEKLGFVYYRTYQRFYTLNGKSYDAYGYVYFFDEKRRDEVRAWSQRQGGGFGL